MAIAPVPVAFTACSDDGRPLSGVATAATASSTTVSVNGIPTTTSICSGATDNAGNVAPTVTQTYVAPFTFVGFLAPVDNAPTPNTGTAGQDLPDQVPAQGPAGRLHQGPAGDRVDDVQDRLVVLGLGDALESQSSGNSQLTFDAATNTFQYNWKTPSQKGCYEFRLALADGTDEDRDLQPQVGSRSGRRPQGRRLTAAARVPPGRGARAHRAIARRHGTRPACRHRDTTWVATGLDTGIVVAPYGVRTRG